MRIQNALQQGQTLPPIDVIPGTRGSSCQRHHIRCSWRCPLIAKDKELAAFKALQAVLVRGRAMAFQKEDHSKIENLLDRSEYLVALIYQAEDMTATFRANLVDLAEIHRCGIALTKFDTNC